MISQFIAKLVVLTVDKKKIIIKNSNTQNTENVLMVGLVG